MSVPVTVGGNAVSVLGDSSSTGAAGAHPGTSATSPTATSGAGGLLGGTQLALPLSVPVTLGGNAISVIGDSTADGPTTGNPGNPGNPGGPGNPGDPAHPASALPRRSAR